MKYCVNAVMPWVEGGGRQNSLVLMSLMTAPYLCVDADWQPYCTQHTFWRTLFIVLAANGQFCRLGKAQWRTEVGVGL